MKHIVIIGNGIAGITAARHIRKRSNYKITVISSETEYFFSRTALMYIYMGHMKFEHTQPYPKSFWKKNKIDLRFARVETIDTDLKQLSLKEQAPIAYDVLLLATGSKPNKFGWPGQELDGVQGLYSYQDLEKLTQNPPKKAVIVGGGLIGVELAEMLLYTNTEVSFLVRESYFWGNVLPKQDALFIDKHMQQHALSLSYNTELKSIEGDGNGKVKSITTTDGEVIPCDFVGLTAGVSPNIDFVKSSKIACDRGILVDSNLQTNIEDVYALGDCAQLKTPAKGRRAIEQVWYTGRMMGETIAATVTGTPTAYLPGHWFNSAKFFDMEYQTYGMVPAQLQEGASSFYWEDKTDKAAMHFVWDTEKTTFLGVNSYGIRLRHENFDHFLKTNASITAVLEGLEKANFDPEFFKSYHGEIIDSFNEQHPELKVNHNSNKRLISKIFGL